MKKFVYKARNRTGGVIQGSIVVEDRNEAIEKLREQGLLIVNVRESKNQEISLRFKKTTIKPKNLAILCRQFAIQLQAGLSLVDSLNLLQELAGDKKLQAALEDVRLEVASGASLTKALEKHKNIFPHVFIYMIEAGELIGALPEVLERLAIYYEREDELRKKTTEALMYPGIIFGFTSVITILILFVVLPNLLKNFLAFGVEPPLVTRIVLNVRDWVVNNIFYLVTGFILFYIAIKWYFSTKIGKYVKDGISLKIPLIGNVLKMVILSRFCRTMSLLMRSGISMIQSLEILERLIDNSVIKRVLQEARMDVQSGQAFANRFSESKIFHAMFIQMVAIGEETGSLETTLAHLSDFYDREVNFLVGNLTRL